MNTSSIAKTKHDSARKDNPVKPPTTFDQWSPLLVAFILIFAWFGFSFFSMSLMRYQKVPMFYPMLLAMNSPHEWIVVGVIALTALFCHRSALHKGLRGRWIALSLFLQSNLVMAAFLFASIPTIALTHVNTVWTEGHVYQLVHGEKGLSQISGSQSYIVLDCDTTGLVCSHYATPYERSNSCFGEGGTLFIDPTMQVLALQVRPGFYNASTQQGMLEESVTVLAVQPNDDIWYGIGCPVKGLTR